LKFFGGYQLAQSASFKTSRYLPPLGMSKRNVLRRMRTRSRTPQSGRAEDAEQKSSSYVEDAETSHFS
jgi:hypothetical protein